MHDGMEVGVFLPISGRAAGPEALTKAARQAERLGFDTVWSADRVVTPWRIKTPYPYAKGNAFIVPPDRPFLDSLTCLAYLAGRTKTIRLGISVLVLPYRHPLYWSRIVSTIDRLSGGRFMLGVGCGWMEEEFAAQGVDYLARGRITDEQLAVARLLFKEDHISHQGDFYRFADVALYPKAERSRHMPIWVGGEGRAARRRAARLGDGWFPYFVGITPSALAKLFGEVLAEARREGRDESTLDLAVCLPIELTKRPVEQDPARLRGSPEQLSAALIRFKEAGVRHVALQFMVAHLRERLQQIGRFGRDVLPEIR